MLCRISIGIPSSDGVNAPLPHRECQIPLCGDKGAGIYYLISDYREMMNIPDAPTTPDPDDNTEK